MDPGNLARPERFELPTSWFVARRSIQLSYGRTAESPSVPTFGLRWGRACYHIVELCGPLAEIRGAGAHIGSEGGEPVAPSHDLGSGVVLPPRLGTPSESKAHRGGRQRCHMTADLDALGAVLAAHPHMQETAAIHLCALLADEPCAVGIGDEPMAHHERRQRSGRAASSRIFRDAVFGGEHSRIGTRRW